MFPLPLGRKDLRASFSAAVAYEHVAQQTGAARLAWANVGFEDAPGDQLDKGPQQR